MNHRYFNITMIDVCGSPLSTQITTTDFAGAERVLFARARRGAENMQNWDKPLIAAYIFDTKTGQLNRYEVDENGKVNQIG